MPPPLTPDDRAVVDAFESCRPPPQGFGHREHLQVAWAYLQAAPFLPALERYRRHLRAFARAAGAPGKYHETVTCAFLALLDERVRGAPPGEGFGAFLARNPDLSAGLRALHARGYTPELLASEAARHAFVLPEPAAPATVPAP